MMMGEAVFLRMREITTTKIQYKFKDRSGNNEGKHRVAG